jgi:hypothetical protein
MILGVDHSQRRVAGRARAKVANVLARWLSGRRDAAGLPPLGVRRDRNYQGTTRGLGTDLRTLKGRKRIRPSSRSATWSGPFLTTENPFVKRARGATLRYARLAGLLTLAPLPDQTDRTHDPARDEFPHFPNLPRAVPCADWPRSTFTLGR